MKTNIQCQESFSALISELIGPIAHGEIVDLAKDYLTDRCHEIAASTLCKQLNGHASWLKPGIHSVRELEVLLHSPDDGNLMLSREALNHAIGEWFNTSFRSWVPAAHTSVDSYLKKRNICASSLLEIIQSGHGISKEAFAALRPIHRLLLSKIQAINISLYDHAITHAANARTFRALQLFQDDSIIGNILERATKIKGQRRVCTRRLDSTTKEPSSHELELLSIDQFNRVKFSSLPLSEIIARVDQMLLQGQFNLILYCDTDPKSSLESKTCYAAKLKDGRVELVTPNHGDTKTHENYKISPWPEFVNGNN